MKVSFEAGDERVRHADADHPVIAQLLKHCTVAHRTLSEGTAPVLPDHDRGRTQVAS